MHEEEQKLEQTTMGTIDWGDSFVVDVDDDEEVQQEKKVHIEDLDSMDPEKKAELLSNLKKTKEDLESFQALSELTLKYLDDVYGEKDYWGEVKRYDQLISEEHLKRKDAIFEGFLLNFCGGDKDVCQQIMSYIRNKAKAYLKNETRTSTQMQHI